jgi:hypothetical protein
MPTDRKQVDAMDVCHIDHDLGAPPPCSETDLQLGDICNHIVVADAVTN